MDDRVGGGCTSSDLYEPRLLRRNLQVHTPYCNSISSGAFRGHRETMKLPGLYSRCNKPSGVFFVSLSQPYCTIATRIRLLRSYCSPINYADVDRLIGNIDPKRKIPRLFCAISHHSLQQPKYCRRLTYCMRARKPNPAYLGFRLSRSKILGFK